MYFAIQNIFTFYGFCLVIFFVIFSNSQCNKKPVRDLRYLNNMALRNFTDSFDTVITDISAILKQSSDPIKAVVFLKRLEKVYNKTSIFLMDNNIYSMKKYLLELKENFNYIGNEDQFILPHEPLLWYLKKFRLKGKAFVIGSDQFRKTLIDAGVNVVPPLNYSEKIINACNTDKEIKRVIVNLDASVDWDQLIHAGFYLQNESVQFLAGTAQTEGYINKLQKDIGFGYFEKILTYNSGRIPLRYGKPGILMKDYILDRYPAIASNPSRVLFIGHSLDVDMKYAGMCGFQKLWLDSNATRSTLLKLEKDCMTTPDYYLPHMNLMRLAGYKKKKITK